MQSFYFDPFLLGHIHHHNLCCPLQPVQTATSCATRVCVWTRAGAATAWMTARTRVTKSSAVSPLTGLHNGPGHEMGHDESRVALAPCLPFHTSASATCLFDFSFSFFFAARPMKNCGGSSPLHPLFVCNGEEDCADGRDELNCTQGRASYRVGPPTPAACFAL